MAKKTGTAKVDVELLKDMEKELAQFTTTYMRAQQELDSMLRVMGMRLSKGKKPNPLRVEAGRFLGYPQRIKELKEELIPHLKPEIEELSQQHPLWQDFLCRVKGIGPLLAGLLIGVSGDIEKVESASGFWKSFGIVIDDETEKIKKMVKGEQGKIGWPLAVAVRGRIRVSVFKTGAAHGGYLYELYQRVRDYYDKFRPDWPAGRRLGAAIVVMHKVFLAVFWMEYRRSHGLTAHPPNILFKLGNGKPISAEDLMEKRR